MSDGKYNVIMMRDDTSVRRFRLNPFWIRFFSYFIFFLLITAAGGGYAGFVFWHESSALRLENRNLERALRESQIELERLRNIDRIIKSNDPGQLERLFDRKGEEDEQHQAGSYGADQVDLAKLFESVDQGQAGIENLQAEIENSELKMVFNLSNLREDMLSGQVEINLLTTGGRLFAPRLKKSDLTFHIQRFKQFDISFSLPETVAKPEIFGLRLTIRNSGGQIIFRETYPLSALSA